MTGVFLQVRLHSTRLPRKVLIDLSGRCVVEHAMCSLRRLPASHHVLLTDAQSARELGPVAERCGFDLFVGPEEDVLERYVLAARRYGVDQIVRATGDNPLVSWELARMAVALLRATRADYVGYDGPPLGTGVEVLSARALERALRESRDPYDHEHVSPYLYRNPDLFTIRRVPAPPAYQLPEVRVTLDTPSDYEVIARVFDALYDGTPIPVLRLIRWLAQTNAQEIRDVHASRA